MAETAPPTAIVKETQPPASIQAKELGVASGLTFQNFITGETVSVLPVSYKNLRKMTEQDGQARALLQLLTMPIRAARWDVLDESESLKKPIGSTGIVGTTSSEERAFVFHNLFDTPQEGGMTVPFNQIIASMALAVRDGFRLFEKVFRLDDRGRIVIKKLAFRDNDTLSLITDDHGDFNGARQQVYFGGKLIDVVLEKEKVMLFVHGKEENQLYGAPVFLPVYYHYDKKHKLYYISHVAFQVLAIPPRIGTKPVGTQQPAHDKFLSDLSTIGFNAAMVVPDGFKVEAFESRRSLADMMPLIDHHNQQMAQAVLANFIELKTSATGKLFAEGADLFILALQAVIRDIEDTFNLWLIPQLIDFNFGGRRYPKLRARPFTDKQQELLHSVFKEIMTSGAEKSSPQFLIEVERRMALGLGIDTIGYDDLAKKAVAEHELMQRLRREQASNLATARAAGGKPNTTGTRGGQSGGAGESGNG